MASGRYDHPAYLARLACNMGVSAAGTTAQAGLIAFPWPIKIHTINAVVATAGTVTTAAVALMNGTATIGSVVVGTSTANSVVNSTADIAYTLPANTAVGLLYRLDATGVSRVLMEYSIATTGTWLGGE